MNQLRFALLGVSLLVGACTVLDHQPGAPAASTLITVGESNIIWNGVATSNNRVFVCYPRNDGSAGIRIGELLSNGTVQPYPNTDWNSWTPGTGTAETAQKFVRANSIRFGPDGYLWIVDTGTPKTDGAVVPNGPKLIAVDISTNQVVKSIPLDGVALEKSFVDDLRFNGSYIYVTDAGVPALIVHNTQTGQSRRTLENDSLTTQRRPLYGEGKILYKPNGDLVKLHADQMEVSPDGSTYYFQPASGPLYSVPTSALNDASLSSADLAKQVKLFYDTPTTGGTAMDADGNIYLNDANAKKMIKITPSGQASTVLQDERLVWGDAMWIDNDGYIWIPAPQMNRTPEFNRGVSVVQFPVKLYKLKIDVKPLRR